MTLEEAEAFVGAERCIMKTLTETDLYCEPPEVQPPPKRRQKRDTAHNLPEFIVRESGRAVEGLGSLRRSHRCLHLPVLSPSFHTGEVWLPRVGARPGGVRHACE